MNNKDKKTYSSQEAKDVFANQLERFELSEQEQAVAEKLDKKDFSKCEAIMPGFINMKLSGSFLQRGNHIAIWHPIMA